MYQLLFRSRWIALIWVVATMISVAAFVDEGGKLDQMESTAGVGQSPRPAASPADPEDDGFTPDTELVDDTSGLEPVDEGSRRAGGKPADPAESFD